MTATGGAFEEITIDARRFAVESENEGERDLGGKTNAILMNSDQSGAVQQTARPWKLSVTVRLDDSLQDAEFLQEKANSGQTFPIGATTAGGKTYSGEGTITGEISTKVRTTTVDIELSGPGSLEVQ